MNSINFNNLKEYKFTQNMFCVEKNKIDYKVKIINKNSNKTLIVVSSEIMHTKEFKREILGKYLSCNIIFINDPTPEIHNIEVGWGQGTEDVFCIDELAEILNVLLEKLNTKNNYFFGTAAGAFIAIYLAALFKSNALGIEAHFYPLNFYVRHVSNLQKQVYKNYSIKDIKDIFNNRISLIELFKILDYIPNLNLYYNLKSQYYIATQMDKFLKGLESLEISQNNFLNIQASINKEKADSIPNELNILQFINSIVTNGELA